MDNQILTEEEKSRIRQEELYRLEVKKQISKETFFDKIDGPIKLLQGTAIALGVFASLWQYKSNSENERQEAAREYQKSFYQAQMSVYAEAVTQTSVLANADTLSEDYITARNKFFSLYWGRMSIFEDKCVEEKMVQFEILLKKFETHDYRTIEFEDLCNGRNCVYNIVTQETLRVASLRLAHQCRVYTIKTWIPPEEQDKYNLVDTSGCLEN